jgi:deoxyribose-phosphate aldolase
MSNSSKYKSALEKYNINLNDAEIKKEVDLLIKTKVVENDTIDVKKALFSFIDLTTLKQYR